ncbi:MAG TPA: hydantoinase B/oxoprolinase family protein [Solirubrobacteraceae bacterium]|nr:hydantoinase B/oxoprolinase family protein [Solirubrobacteraceae bacterium]
MTASSTERTLDGVGLAVVASRFEGIVRTMQNTLVRTGRSGVLNTAKDCSCCVLSAGDELIAMAESLPLHVMCGPDLVAQAVRTHHPVLVRGDAFLHNSPYEGNSHAADYCMVVPIVDDEGRHRYSVFVKAHQADCGNALPTTYDSSARDVYSEGALIFSAAKVQSGYEHCHDVLRMCRARIRVPEQWWGDHLAMLGACRVGEQRLLELGGELGWEALESYVQQWLDYSERRMEAELRRLPEGRTRVRTMHDPTPQLPDGLELQVDIDIRPQEGRVVVDLAENPDCLPCGLNLTEATSRSSALLGVFNSVDHTVPQNAGSARRIDVRLRENCCVGIPRHPASCSVATTNFVDRVANAVQRGMGDIADGIGMAEYGLSFPPSVAVISGKDPRAGGAPYINQIILGWTGGPGGPHADGWLTAGGVGDGGALRHDSIELDELHFPVLFSEQRLLPDTEGAGRHRGVPAARLTYGPLGTSMEVAYGSDGSVHGPQGARGGDPGASAQQFKLTASGEREAVDSFALVPLADGESMVSICCGGGGYGPPRERAPEAVAADVAEGLVSAERAASVYGVVVDDDGAVDSQATARLRSEAAP